MKITASIVPMLDEAWDGWALAVNRALSHTTRDGAKALRMGFFCLETVHFL